MAREFLYASSESVADTSIASPFSSVKRTMAATVKFLTVGGLGRYLVVLQVNDSGNYCSFMLSNSDIIRYRTQGATAGVHATSDFFAKANIWYRLVGMSLSATDHRLYINGRLAGTNTGDIGTWAYASINRIMVGGNPWAGEYCDAHIAEVAVWDGALSVPDVLRYGRGYPTSRICPQLLRIYVPFVNNDRDLRGGNVLSTVTGSPTWAPHPMMRSYGAVPVFPYEPAGGLTREERNLLRSYGPWFAPMQLPPEAA